MRLSAMTWGTRMMGVLSAQAYALLLAGIQMYIGVRTDEAKYLLNIPYPHPPLARYIFGLTDGWMYQEALWRIACATLLVQAVWLVLSLARTQSHAARTAIAAGWLLSAAVIYQAGTVMMAPLTALQGLFFLWLLMRERGEAAQPAIVGLVWLASLFTAYQAVLYGPIVLWVFMRTRIRPLYIAVLFLTPLLLLALYTLTNPFAAASMVVHAGKDAQQTLHTSLTETLWIWVLGGSGIVSMVGTAGLYLRPRWGLVLSLLLVMAYIFLSRYDYYAILLSPLFAVGFVRVLRLHQHWAVPLLCLMPVFAIACIVLRPPQLGRVLAADVMAQVGASGSNAVFINGPFGHEWQYESSSPVRRYRVEHLTDARAVICLKPCDDMHKQPGWGRLQDAPVEVWLPLSLL